MVRQKANPHKRLSSEQDHSHSDDYDDDENLMDMKKRIKKLENAERRKDTRLIDYRRTNPPSKKPVSESSPITSTTSTTTTTTGITKSSTTSTPRQFKLRERVLKKSITSSDEEEETKKLRDKPSRHHVHKCKKYVDENDGKELIENNENIDRRSRCFSDFRSQINLAKFNSLKDLIDKKSKQEKKKPKMSKDSNENICLGKITCYFINEKNHRMLTEKQTTSFMPKPDEHQSIASMIESIVQQRLLKEYPCSNFVSTKNV
ncbi:hypothetical protein SNEBB_006371 [Seison nebaliae]|nr:hypothetical protein SNEBB_006371 [Seison nebaliae]